MEVKDYNKRYKNQVISLILFIQNCESKVDISLEEQPDINNVESEYIQKGGGFWVAVNENDNVIGTLGLIKKGEYGILKKFFILKECRGKTFGVSEILYEKLYEFAKNKGLRAIILDTPAVCKRAHGFYKKKGFKIISKEELPLEYNFPDRNSVLFIKYLY